MGHNIGGLLRKYLNLAIGNSSESILRFIFVALFLQLQVIIFSSLMLSTGPAFVEKHFSGFDFYDFYTASGEWIRGINPYLRRRFCTPPPSLLVGLSLHWAGFRAGHLLFAVINLALILTSVWVVARRLSLSNAARYWMAGITLLYYPVLFLVERGNLDGLMLACLVFAAISDRPWLRAALIGLSAGLKLYSILLLVPLARERRWRAVAGILLLLALLLLPFIHLLAPFGTAILNRGTEMTGTENLSPAVILGGLAKTWIGKSIFLLFWAGTFLAAVTHEQEKYAGRLILPYLPWMVAFPMQVYPYTGILLLPVLAWRVRQIDGGSGAGVIGERRICLADMLFFLGFLFVGVQAPALTQYYRWLVYSHRFFHAFNYLGMILILIGTSLPRANVKSDDLLRN